MAKKSKPQSGQDLKTDDGAPPWLAVMRAITGTAEVEGSGSNPKIVGMAAYIGRKFEEQAEYAALYTTDDTAWCGVATAFCLAAATPEGIRAPFSEDWATDGATDCWMWAQSFASDENFVPLDTPELGCICVFSREGGGHVSLYEYSQGSSVYVRGGNQSNAVTLAPYSKSSLIGYYWPRAYGDVPRRMVEEGDTGSDVTEIQTLLLGEDNADGEFGPITTAAVEGFQRACDLEADGVVGPDTWKALDALGERLKGSAPYLSEGVANAVIAAAEGSDLALVSWRDRGKAPVGYTVGMALCYALALRWLESGQDAAQVMAQELGDDDEDALTWYDLDGADGAEIMRNLWALLIGLGPRESSGNHWEGIDASAGASSESSDTCEAGLFQSSWNLASSDPSIEDLLDYFLDNPDGWLDQFNRGASPSDNTLNNWGAAGARGVVYQWSAKRTPPLAAMMTAVGLRKRRQHWGPINRKEVEVRQEAFDLLQQIEAIVSGEEPRPPEPPDDVQIVEIRVSSTPGVRVTVNGTDLADL